MSCPIHIWVPLMAAAVPAARAVRTRLSIALDARREDRSAAAAPRVMKRWSPVGLPESSAPIDPEQSRPS
ncbi:MAG: hypothetical protein O2924_02345 [Chloroflexi bacterium]|nr:hypothetical protein [Chloroflexota bacterium]